MLIESRHRQSICEFLCDKLKDKTKKNKKCKVIVIFTAVCVDVDLHFTCADFVFHFRWLGKCRLQVNVFFIYHYKPVTWASCTHGMNIYFNLNVAICWRWKCNQLLKLLFANWVGHSVTLFFFDNINSNIEDEAMLKNQ